jgi:hypothetical protein
LIEVGSGEAVMNNHLENMDRLTGLMREEPGPVGFKPGPRYHVTPVPRAGRSYPNMRPIPASEAEPARVIRAGR